MASNDVVLPGTDVVLFDDKAAVAQAAADAILAAADEAIERHGRFRLCLAGGTTPTAAYKLLADADADWSRWWIYHGDERCLPAADPERNSLAADQAWLNRVPVPRGRCSQSRPRLELRPPPRPMSRSQRRRFRSIWCSWGSVRTATPRAYSRVAAVPDDRLAMPVHDSPKPPPDRVSLTIRAFSQSEQLLILVTGGGKAMRFGIGRRVSLCRFRRLRQPLRVEC
jgi:6-phosphogluconolactonase